LKSNSAAFSICSASAGRGAAATAAAAVPSSRGSCCTKGRAELGEEDATGFSSGAARRGEQDVVAAAIIALAIGAA
jgi:hypothetical protein